MYPLALLYGSLVKLHKGIYQLGILPSKSFDFPVLNVGNLSVGGTGKSPHVAYLNQLLSPLFKTAIVSRGYHRQTKGVRLVEQNSLAEEVGDEPLQLKQNFPNTPILVAEHRVLGIETVLKQDEKINCVLLDDAFQHWRIRANVQILLTTFEQPFFEDWVLPMGRLREFKSGYRRADIIIVTKCPSNITPVQKAYFCRRIQPFPHQQIFFSYFKYQTLYSLLDRPRTRAVETLKGQDITLITAIANTSYLEEHLLSYVKSIQSLKFLDHHYYTQKDLEKLKRIAQNQLIITTEKDAVKLKMHQTYLEKEGMEIYVLPIEVEIAFNERQMFKTSLLNLIHKKYPASEG